MSFSADCKNEMCRVPPARACCARAELYGCLLFGRVFSPGELRILTAHDGVAARLTALMDGVYGLRFEIGGQGGKRALYSSGPGDARAVLDGFGYGGEPFVAVHLNRAVIEDDCCMAALTRGAFLTGGFAASREYHLELVTPHAALSRELSALLSELGLPPKAAQRAGHRVLYYKASESIEDFLTLCGAPLSALSLMEAKVEKDMRNRVNRKVNCETANSVKAANAAVAQCAAFGRLRGTRGWDKLPDTLRRAAEARLNFPEDTLSELAGRLGVTKSCLNHRLRRLLEISENA